MVSHLACCKNEPWHRAPQGLGQQCTVVISTSLGMAEVKSCLSYCRGAVSPLLCLTVNVTVSLTARTQVLSETKVSPSTTMMSVFPGTCSKANQMRTKQNRAEQQLQAYPANPYIFGGPVALSQSWDHRVRSSWDLKQILLGNFQCSDIVKIKYEIQLKTPSTFEEFGDLHFWVSLRRL